MRLATPQKVLQTMGVAESGGSQISAGHALDVSFPVVEKVLESSLEFATVVDFFDYRGKTSAVGFYTYDLRLTQRYVDEDSVVVRYSTDGSALTDPMSGVIVPPSSYRLNPSKGVLTLIKPFDDGASVLSVSYDAGFAEGQPVPSVLEQLAVGAAVLALNVLTSSATNRENVSVQQLTAALFGHLSIQAQPLQRPRMAVEFPSDTMVL